MIVITGASGVVGTKLLDELAHRDDVRAVVSSESSRQKVGRSGLHTVVADLGNVDSLGDAFEGADSLFLLAPAGPGQPLFELNALEAAERKGIDRVVYQSLYNTGVGTTTLRDWHLPAERRLEASQFSWVVLQPPVFTDNLLGMVDALANGVIVWPDSNGALSHIDARDIASVARYSLENDDLSGYVSLTGPEALTYPQLAARLTSLIGRPIHHLEVSPEDFRDGAVQAGVPEAYAEALMDASRYFGAASPFVDTSAIERASGTAARPVDDLVRERLVPALAAAAI